MPWNSTWNPFSKAFWQQVKEEDWGQDFKRAGAELMSYVTSVYWRYRL